MKKILFSIFFLTNTIFFAQDVNFYGSPEPGNLIAAVSPGAIHAELDSVRLYPDGNGLFVFGFDRDDKGSHYLKILYDNGKSFVRKITLPKRKYKIQRINRMKKKYVNAPQTESERIKKERSQIREARSKIGQEKKPLYASGFMRPVEGGWISSVFGSQRILNGQPRNAHNGYDIAAAEGTPVYAMADGNVVFAADTFFYSGNFIILDHGQGLNSMYLHLSKKNVREGDFVKKGDKIGEIGTTGRSTGPHLHWGVQWYGKRVDPYGLLKMPSGFIDE